MEFMTKFTDAFLNRAPNPNKIEVFGVMASLVNRYSEPTRFYHGFSHIKEGLETYAKLVPTPLDTLDFFSWVFHDSVYDTKLSNNEEQSAALFMKEANTLGFSMEEADKVSHTILSTNPSAEPVGIVNDIDFSFLGATEKIYSKNIANIRKEYDWVKPALWKKGRIAILTQLLARPKLYVTPLFHKKFEIQARKNMKK